MNRRATRTGESVKLPDFCSLPVLFALLVVAALAVILMLLAPGLRFDPRAFGTAGLFAVWLALAIAVLLCKSRLWLERLPGVGPYVGAWAMIVAVVALASVIVWQLDHALMAELTPASERRFVYGNLSAAALIALALLRYLYILTQWRQRLAAVAQARVEALQARIRPHFLFNSMNTVAALVRVDPEAAERTIEDLSALFRAALGKEGNGTLGEELDLIDCYLGIEQRRLGERLQVERDIEALPRDLPLPRLLLQPLVENAVLHGVQPRRDGGSVRLRGRRLRDAIEFSIDNPLPATPPTAGTGHGLESVRQRVHYHFGRRGAFEQRVVDDRYVIVLRIPLASDEATEGMEEQA